MWMRYRHYMYQVNPLLWWSVFHSTATTCPLISGHSNWRDDSHSHTFIPPVSDHSPPTHVTSTPPSHILPSPSHTPLHPLITISHHTLHPHTSHHFSSHTPPHPSSHCTHHVFVHHKYVHVRTLFNGGHLGAPPILALRSWGQALWVYDHIELIRGGHSMPIVALSSCSIMCIRTCI